MQVLPGSDIEIVTHGAITEEALKARSLLNEKISIGVRTIIDWQAWFSDTAQHSDKSKPTIILEEHRDVGLLAHQMMNKKLLGTNFNICCVTDSEFSKCTTRVSALKLNKLDCHSIVRQIEKMSH